MMKLLVTGILVTGILLTRAFSAQAQQDDRYRIGAGDVLDIRVYNRPQLSRGPCAWKAAA
jgi:protein involved in polysaccharide export with SLBB domain